LKPSTIINK